MRYIVSLVILIIIATDWTGTAARCDDNSAAEFFNGKDLQGWEGLMEYWSVKDGAIVGTAPPEGLKFNTFLCSKKKYKDFELTFKIRLKNGAGNSGVQIRSKIFDREHFAVAGPQCDIGDIYWGSLYGEHFGGICNRRRRKWSRKSSRRTTSTIMPSAASASTSPSS